MSTSQICSFPPMTRFVVSQVADEWLRVAANTDGVPMRFGTRHACKDLLYCGRALGQRLIPHSDGRCGPNDGPQCPACRDTQMQQLRHPSECWARVTNQESSMLAFKISDLPSTMGHVATKSAPTKRPEIGDRVVVTRPEPGYHQGKEASVIKDDKDNRPYRLLFDDGSEKQYYDETQVRLVQNAPLRHPRHQHRLVPKDGTYYCDVCRAEGCAASKSADTCPRFRCQRCDWDSCLDCMARVNNTHQFVVTALAKVQAAQVAASMRPAVGDQVISTRNEAGYFPGQSAIIIKDDKDNSPFTLHFANGVKKGFYKVNQVRLVAKAAPLQHPAHPHVLQATDGEDTYSSYNCDVCGKSGRCSSSALTFRCMQCKWDACPACMKALGVNHPLVELANTNKSNGSSLNGALTGLFSALLKAGSRRPPYKPSSTPVTEASATQNAMQRVTCIVPPGAISGSTMRMQTPDGQVFEAVVPPGVPPGGTFVVDVPRHPINSTMNPAVQQKQEQRPPAAPPPGMTALTVTVPSGCGPGAEIQIQAPGGLMRCVVPAGVHAGQVFQVFVPAAQSPPNQPGPAPSSTSTSQFDASFLNACTDVSTIVSVMRDRPSDVSAQGHACAALARISEGESSCRGAAVSQGAVELLLKTMQIHAGEPGVVAAVCKAMRFLAQGSQPTIHRFVSGGVIQCVCGAMQRHQQYAAVQAWACAALKGFAWDSDTRIKIAREGCIGAIVSCALQIHGGDATVVLEALMALANFVASSALVPAVRAHEHLIRQIKEIHDFNAEVRKHADRVLQTF